MTIKQLHQTLELLHCVAVGLLGIKRWCRPQTQRSLLLVVSGSLWLPRNPSASKNLQLLKSSPTSGCWQNCHAFRMENKNLLLALGIQLHFNSSFIQTRCAFVYQSAAVTECWGYEAVPECCHSNSVGKMLSSSAGTHKKFKVTSKRVCVAGKPAALNAVTVHWTPFSRML